MGKRQRVDPVRRASELFTVNRQSGFSLTEMVVTTGILAVVTLIATTVMTNVNTGANRLNSQTASVDLANELRGLIATRASCASSMVGRPTGFSGNRPIAIRLGANGAVVQAGARPPKSGLEVTSLELRNIVPAGTAQGGDAMYLADLNLTTKSRDQTVAAFRDQTIARVALEAQGANLVACYASDAYLDTTQQFSTMCGQIVSPEGIPSTWSNGHCVVQDVNIGATCGAMGGAWNGSTCVIRRTSFIVSRYVPPGAYNDGTGYGVYCPANSILTGGACSSQIPPRIPMGGMYLGGGLANYFGCAWQLGYEDTGYNIYAACLR